MAGKWWRGTKWREEAGGAEMEVGGGGCRLGARKMRRREEKAKNGMGRCLNRLGARVRGVLRPFSDIGSRSNGPERRGLDRWASGL